MKLKLFSNRHSIPFFHILTVILLLSCVLILFALTVFAQSALSGKGDSISDVYSADAYDSAAVLGETGLDFDLNRTVFNPSASKSHLQEIQTVDIIHNGKSVRIYTYGESIEALLSRLGIVIDSNTKVSQDLSSYTYDGLVLEIGHTVRKVETYTLSIPFETVYQEDPSLRVGQHKTQVNGSAGQLQRIASVLYEDGSEISRTVLAEEVVQEPTSEVILIGTSDVQEAMQSTPVFGQNAVIEDGKITTAAGETLFYKSAMTIRASAYTKTDEGCNDYTSTGSLARVGAIAVDPSVIPYGTRMFIVSDDGCYVYGLATAEDCGGSIIGDRVDLYFDTTYECFQFGRRTCTAYILG